MTKTARLTGIVCVTPDCGLEAVGWVGADDAPDHRHDADGRVWLCEAELEKLWPTAKKGRRPELPGQTSLDLGGDAA